MRGTLFVLPVIDPGAASACVGTFDQKLYPRIVVVDNCHEPWRGNPWDVAVWRPRQNLGVARSWNWSVRYARAEGFDAVCLLSSQVRFGETGGVDLAAVDPGEWGCLPSPAFWHSALFPLRLFDRLGDFDENLFPAYGEDIDWQRRAALAGIHWPHGPEVDLTCVGGDGQGVDKLRHDHPGLPTINYQALMGYFRAKWGVEWTEGTDVTKGHITPFGMPVSTRWWTPASVDELKARYGIVGR